MLKLLDKATLDIAR